MQPCPSSNGVTGSNQSVSHGERGDRSALTSEETTADGSDNDLGTEEGEHGPEDLTAAVVDGVYPNDMDRGADGEEDGSADRFEEVEMRTGLQIVWHHVQYF